MISSKKEREMKYIVDGSDIVLYQEDFNLDETLDCGQAFRFAKNEDGSYSGVASCYALHISANGDEFRFHNVSEGEFLQFWCNYFDLNTDYKGLKACFSQDPIMERACKFAPGIRLLRQDSWETLISFIISANNNIPRIKGIISRLCQYYGEDMGGIYAFPTAKRLSSLSVEDLSPLRAGFRAKYIVDAAQKVYSGEVDLGAITKMPIEYGRGELMKIYGVGPKVAECVLLFGFYKVEAFPLDIWMKRVMENFYPDGLPEFMSENAGIAQQYLFHYARTNADINFTK